MSSMQGITFNQVSIDDLATMLDEKLEQKLAPLNETLKIINTQLEHLSRQYHSLA
ncbi:hypothetical protein FOCG_00825 [Fusarium oxysporum f. sp. radicis-lycopersici 26381]|uniref:Uncharacterized protein n=6 Tax=Fusarium oxysporum TaxID=5507 RepID=A0A0J9UD46_FUSO4|nr:hypothetical protein FOXG_18211 [Fusarium oxysporum f. sp. lycopersici 4287]EWZ44637.1 hypothetical protein FOZG_05326 [Fusarium oxysporum Fo47]EWZ98486.1 hypothetical protein FOWG_02561 [Fusarium oxysporum f. sp. lycopersici MN25]EXK42001.1 hypothetical protein FOMG_05155 [Fusarium oxysporum f. sp. melonis 26406]EXL61964.1 hypothetical protein FOCG_00825 [Fusarium oxysporum f. sp. radicis-lycopersici 26381]RKK23423.1 hypothetical protein BFJ65_g5990 [Fusarium oxysporum f. sp. cepae]RKK806